MNGMPEKLKRKRQKRRSAKKRKGMRRAAKRSRSYGVSRAISASSMRRSFNAAKY